MKRIRKFLCGILGLALLLVLLCGCLNKIPAVAKYQASATEECEKKHTPEECKVLPYPSDQR